MSRKVRHTNRRCPCSLATVFKIHSSLQCFTVLPRVLPRARCPRHASGNHPHPSCSTAFPWRDVSAASFISSADLDSGNTAGGMRRMRRMICRNCATHKTPQWRCGPEGPKTLCNACGLRLRKGHVLERYANLGSNETLPPLLVGASASESGSPCSSCN